MDPTENPYCDHFVQLKNGVMLPVNAEMIGEASDVLKNSISELQRQVGESFSSKFALISTFRDDDPEAATLLLSAIQGRLTPVEPPFLSTLKELAVLIHKYNCAEYVDHVTHVWVSKFRHQAEACEWNREEFSGDEYAFENLLIIAYLVDNPEEFYQISKYLVLIDRDDFYTFGKLMVNVPVTLISVMIHMKNRIQYALMCALNTNMNEFMTALSISANDCSESCTTGIACSLAYVGQLSGEFFPIERKFAYLYDTLILLRNEERIKAWVYSFIQRHLCEKCWLRAHDYVGLLVFHLKQVGSNIENELAKGICLDCIRTDGSCYPHCNVKHKQDLIPVVPVPPRTKLKANTEVKVHPTGSGSTSPDKAEEKEGKPGISGLFDTPASVSILKSTGLSNDEDYPSGGEE